jgi:hypothetical protein
MHLKLIWLRWIEKRLSRGEQRQAQAHLALCPECGAELVEMQDLVEALEAIPAALSTVPWRKERLWPAIWAGLHPPPTALRASRWVSGLSTASLLAVFCGVWWGSMFNAASVTTVEASYVAPPPAASQLLVTPPREELTGNIPPRLVLPTGTPQPLPAPAQTPIFSGTIYTGTVTPGG